MGLDVPRAPLASIQAALDGRASCCDAVLCHVTAGFRSTQEFFARPDSYLGPRHPPADQERRTKRSVVGCALIYCQQPCRVLAQAQPTRMTRGSWLHLVFKGVPRPIDAGVGKPLDEPVGHIANGNPRVRWNGEAKRYEIRLLLIQRMDISVDASRQARHRVEAVWTLPRPGGLSHLSPA